MAGSPLLGPDGNPVVEISGTRPSDRSKQKKWKIGEIESPPLPGNPEELNAAMETVWNGPKGVAFGANMLTPLEALCFQATSIFAKNVEKRLAKLEEDAGPVMQKKRLAKRLDNYEARITVLEGRIKGLQSLVSELERAKREGKSA
jgi:hypothetical protein